MFTESSGVKGEAPLSRAPIPDNIRDAMQKLHNPFIAQLSGNGEIPPTVLFFKVEDGETILIDTHNVGLWLDKGPAGKQAVIAANQMCIKLGLADFTVLICEAWFVNLKHRPETEELQRASEHPDRKECVLCSVQTATAQYLLTSEIERDGEQFKHLNEAIVYLIDGETEGNLVQQKTTLH